MFWALALLETAATIFIFAALVNRRIGICLACIALCAVSTGGLYTYLSVCRIERNVRKENQWHAH